MNHSDYAYTTEFRNGVPMHTDRRHIEVLYRLALGLPPESLIVEIGSWKGASAAAYVEAFQRRADLRAQLYDIAVTPELRRLVAESGVSSRITIFDRPVYKHESALAPAALAFIDGDHGMAALADLAACLAAGCRIIAAHDTRLPGKGGEGSRLLGHLLHNAAGRRCWEDFQARPGEWTQRGFLVSWPDEPAFDWVPAAIDAREQ
jgi:predicted O-methyltransferase YrrM